ncbi:hypothetical protein DCAR_0103908 [Daucus carota subsp. sativus]|nr:PREDICTED: protein BASIC PENTACYSTEINE4 [Daucus carota subsp. sativus]WOG84724.1 hypothetical protein DCAR_0103908 [Daucus carota subsp. sativus]
MDKGGRARHMEFYKGAHSQWNMVPQYQMKDQNAFLMPGKIAHIIAERDAAFEERDRALSERKAALEERDSAIQLRDAAISERDSALREREIALEALRFQETTMSTAWNNTIQRGSKRVHHVANYPLVAAYNTKEGAITDAFPLQAISSEGVKAHQEKPRKPKKFVSSKSQLKAKKINEDLNRHVTTDWSKAEWDAKNLGSMKQIIYDESTMPIPVCSCTGVQHQCYKWGNGGWQSSCCTTTKSQYPLPQLPNKRHSRMGGRKMSGNVFSRLLTRLAAEGHDTRMPLDLKEHWAKHGTNRYITIR